MDKTKQDVTLDCGKVIFFIISVHFQTKDSFDKTDEPIMKSLVAAVLFTDL